MSFQVWLKETKIKSAAPSLRWEVPEPDLQNKLSVILMKSVILIKEIFNWPQP